METKDESAPTLSASQKKRNRKKKKNANANESDNKENSGTKYSHLFRMFLLEGLKKILKSKLLTYHNYAMF